VSFSLFDVILEATQALAPEHFVLPDPGADGPKGFGIQTTDACRTVVPRNDQARGAQHTEML